MRPACSSRTQDGSASASRSLPSRSSPIYRGIASEVASDSSFSRSSPSRSTWATAHCLRHPTLARDLVVTRGRRYAGGLVRLVVTRNRRAAASPIPASPIPASPIPASPIPASAVGEITHVLVDTERQGSGVGSGLIGAAVGAARRAGVDELVLVTPPDLEARNFYEHLGWLADGEITSRSGEPFLRYRLPVAATGEGPVSDRRPS